MRAGGIENQVLSQEEERRSMNFLVFASIAASNALTVAELPPITVRASRIETKIDDFPAVVQVFDAEDIADSLAWNIPDFLEKSSNLGIRRVNGNPLQSQIYMRGFGENSFGRVKILYDGEELNGVDMSAPDLTRMAPAAVNRLEVIHGPSPVLYGDGAIAGVINIVTDHFEGEPITRISAKGGSSGTAGLGFLTRGTFGEEGYCYSATYEYLRSDGYRDRSAFDIHSSHAVFGKKYENESYFLVKANYGNAFYEMPGALSNSEWKSDRKAAAYDDDWCRVWNGGSGFEVKARLADERWLYLDGRLSIRNSTSNWGDYGYANDYALYGFFFSPRYVDNTSIGDFDNVFTAGSDFRYDRYNVKDRSGFNNSAYHFDRFRTAIFLHDEFFLNEDLSVMAGTRCENINSRWNGYRGLADPDSDVYEGDFELGLIWRAYDGLKTYVKASRFHRSPFCDEMNYTLDGKPLEPESGISFDVGLQWAFEKEFDFSLGFYAMRMKDEIFYNPYVTPGPYGWNGYNCNSPSDTQRIGFDTSLTWLREKTAKASISYGAVRSGFTEGQYDSCDVPLVPRHRARAEVGVWLFDDLEVRGGCRYVSAQRLMSDFTNTHGKLGGYTVFDIGFVYSPSWAEEWKLTAVIDNLLDRNYCDFAGWSDWSGVYCYPACGRSFLITIEYEF
jgi:iron complex outermembrane receptor protein